MKKVYRNPTTSPTPKSYTHSVSVEGGRTIYLAGQVAFDQDRNIVGGDDIVAQTRQTMRNVQAAVEAGGGQLSDIVQFTTHVVNYEYDQINLITETMTESFAPDALPTNTMVGVTALSTDGLLIEITGVAVTDAPLPE